VCWHITPAPKVCSPPRALCRVDNERVVTNRPLAGTRRRGVTPEADQALEKELLADEKEVRDLTCVHSQHCFDDELSDSDYIIY
jgi:anthranilate/para-aminobenzoate synthase component I